MDFNELHISLDNTTETAVTFTTNQRITKLLSFNVSNITSLLNPVTKKLAYSAKQQARADPRPALRRISD